MAQKNTKRLLIASIVSVVLCLTMLVGTTFAWFTDEVTSGMNTIVAGQLDVELEYKRKGMAAYSLVTDETTLFDESAKWEPGYVEYVDLKINNKGTLAFKYDLGLNVGKVVGNLDEHLKYAFIGTGNNTREGMLTAAEKCAKTIKEATGETDTIEAGKSVEKTLVVYMPNTVGNEVNTGKASIELGVKLFASQAAVEGDSFDNKYDENATAAQTFDKAGTHTLNGVYFVGKAGDVAVKADGKDVTVNIESGYYDGGEGGNNVGVWATGGAKVNISGGKFTVGADANGLGNSVIYAQNGAIVNISGGEFWTDSVYNGKHYVLNLNNNTGSKIVVTGGSFRDQDPSKGDDNEGGNFVAKGYTVIAEERADGHTWYTVVKEVASSEETIVARVNGAVVFQQGNTYGVKLGSNVTVSGSTSGEGFGASGYPGHWVGMTIHAPSFVPEEDYMSDKITFIRPLGQKGYYKQSNDANGGEGPHCISLWDNLDYYDYAAGDNLSLVWQFDWDGDGVYETIYKMVINSVTLTE